MLEVPFVTMPTMPASFMIFRWYDTDGLDSPILLVISPTLIPMVSFSRSRRMMSCLWLSPRTRKPSRHRLKS